MRFNTIQKKKHILSTPRFHQMNKINKIGKLHLII